MVFRVAGGSGGGGAFVAGYYGSFYYDKGTTLTAQLSNIEVTSMSVASTTDFASSGNLYINNEIITYTGKTATTFTGLTRGVAGTSSATHTSGSAVTSAQIAAANTVTTVRINTTDISVGVSVVNDTKITFAHAGTYNIQISAQLINASNSVDAASIWFSKNGTDIADTCSVVTVPKKDGSTPGAVIVAVNLFVTVAATDYVELRWSTSTGNSVLVTYPSSTTAPVKPASPALIVTATQVG